MLLSIGLSSSLKKKRKRNQKTIKSATQEASCLLHQFSARNGTTGGENRRRKNEAIVRTHLHCHWRSPFRGNTGAQSEIADYGFGRSCDTEPRFSLDIGRISIDDPRYSFDEPRASCDVHFMGRSLPRVPPMVSVIEDAPVVHVQRADDQIPVEESLFISALDDFSETFELTGFKDSASGIGNRGNGRDQKKSRSGPGIYGVYPQEGSNGNKDEEDDRYSRSNGVERSFSGSWQDMRRETNGDLKGGLNRNMFRSNSSVSWRNSTNIGGSLDYEESCRRSLPAQNRPNGRSVLRVLRSRSDLRLWKRTAICSSFLTIPRVLAAVNKGLHVLPNVLYKPGTSVVYVGIAGADGKENCLCHSSYDILMRGLFGNQMADEGFYFEALDLEWFVPESISFGNLIHGLCENGYHRQDF
ncbi:hypothetical protein HAX54_021658 [Datura stramonium]|uniref:Uncharacterized protein n=1 Tax=Datura stramonium TaxID=4076 RepID=A0ABS8RJP2_DATST|nr:hypothetical protein [Datura stramonium]